MSGRGEENRRGLIGVQHDLDPVLHARSLRAVRISCDTSEEGVEDIFPSGRLRSWAPPVNNELAQWPPVDGPAIERLVNASPPPAVRFAKRAPEDNEQSSVGK